MTTITITPDLIERLGDFSKRIEFRDQQGHLIGEYYPIRRSQEYVNPIDGSPFTEEEIQRMAEQPIEELTGRPLEEILKELESRS